MFRLPWWWRRSEKPRLYTLTCRNCDYAGEALLWKQIADDQTQPNDAWADKLHIVAELPKHCPICGGKLNYQNLRIRPT